MNTSKIILTADDFGACDYIDDGIKKALKERRINSVASFVCFPDSYERIDRLLQFRRDEGLDFSIGLHFSVTAGFPLTKGSSISRLDSNGKYCFHDPEDFFDRGLNRPDEIAEELNEQIETLEAILISEGYDVTTRRIDNVSNHHGVVYIDNKLFQEYLRVIDNYGIPIRSPLPWSKSGLPVRNVDRRLLNPTIREGTRLGFIKRFFSAAQPGKRVRMTKEYGLLTPFCLLDEFYGQPEPSYLEFLISQYGDKSFASEFMFHLGDPDQRHTADKEKLPGINFDYFDTREEELNVLLQVNIPSLLNRYAVKACSFRELAPTDSTLK